MAYLEIQGLEEPDGLRAGIFTLGKPGFGNRTGDLEGTTFEVFFCTGWALGTGITWCCDAFRVKL